MSKKSNKQKTMIIVESPKKARKIQELLGGDYVVAASQGHIVDLAKGGKNGMGVDIENGFKPKYVLMDDKVKVLDNLIKLAKDCDNILLASDPDREGTAIAWHLRQRLSDLGKPFKRMIFHKIAKPNLLKAIKEAGEIDMNTVSSQEARRVLDRIVGFTASPFLMNILNNTSLSSGRVQSVLVRLVIDREKEIITFVPETFFTLQVKLTDGKNPPFITKYQDKITDQTVANSTKQILLEKSYVISSVLATEEKKYPFPPLITSTLQRIMSKKHGFAAERTMKAAQSLYESSYISYIRTDSVRVGEEEITGVREWISQNYSHTLPNKPHSYKNKDTAQDAHECIHPVEIDLLPHDNYAIIDPDEKLVYETVWKYFVASQMNPAIYDTLTIVAHPTSNPNAKVKVSGKALKYKGFLEILEEEEATSEIKLPPLKIGDTVALDSGKDAVKLEKKQTQPPPRFSEDKLIEKLEQKNIGRPATYADLLSKITSRAYVEKKGNTYHPTSLGLQITELLTKSFSFMDYNYTSNMEDQLDKIESGKLKYLDMLNAFYPPFKQELQKAYLSAGSLLCEKCQNPLVKRFSKATNQPFWGCSSFPKCNYIKSDSKKVA